MAGDPTILIAAARQVDVIDTAGRIIAEPRRHAPAATAAEVLALACAVETFWAVCLEAELLARTMAKPLSEADGGYAARRRTVLQQLDEITRLMAAIRGETPTEAKETN